MSFFLKTGLGQKQGFNLIESAIVLGVLGVVIGGIWLAASVVIENRKITETVEGLALAVRNIQQQISISDSVAAGNAVNLDSTLIALKAVPANWISGASIKTPFGTLSVGNYISPPRFDMGFYKIPKQVCIKLVPRITALQASTGSVSSYYRGIGLGYVQILGPGNTHNWPTTTFPVTTAQATAACIEETDNVIVLTFGYSRIN